MPDPLSATSGSASTGIVLPTGMSSLLQQQQHLSTPSQIPPLTQLNNNNNDSNTQLYLNMNAIGCPTTSLQNGLTPQASSLFSNSSTPFAQHLLQQQHNEIHLLQQQQQKQLAATVAVAAVAAAQQNCHQQQQFQHHHLQQQHMQQLQQHLQLNQSQHNQLHLQQQQHLAQLPDALVAYTPQ